MIDSKEVDDIFMDCLFKDDELVDGKPEGGFKIGEGVMLRTGFHPGRLQSHEQKIIDILSELPDDFKSSGGGGMSFLNLCMDKTGHQWGEHRNCDQLIALGNAIGKVKFPLPREVWSSLPGGVPYLMIDL